MAWWKKVIVMAAGPTVNILIAFFIFAGLFATYGNIGDQRSAPVVAGVQPCVVPFEESGRQCTPADPPRPAADAGLEAGDRLGGFNGHGNNRNWATPPRRNASTTENPPG